MTFLSAATPAGAQVLLVPKDWLNAAGASLGAWAEKFSGTEGMGAPLWHGITPARLALSVALLVIVAGCVQGYLVWAGWRGRRLRRVVEPTWPRLIGSAIRKPASLLILIFGVYLALAPSLAGVNDRTTREAAFLAFSWMADIAALATWFWLILRVVKAVEHRMTAWAESMPGTWHSLLVDLAGRVLRVAAPLLAAILMLPLIPLPAPLEEIVRRVIAITLILGVAGLIIRAVAGFQRVVLAQNRIDLADNLEARKISTQVRVVGRIIVWMVGLLGLGASLMVFDNVRQFGASILASAGIAGIILGFAAQRTLGHLIAGIQIAISQPIRFDDVLVIDGQFGRVEEINLTYVVLRLWDLRRMVVPITYFFERPFENWTRTGSKILGTAFLYTDYTVPVEELRVELRRVVGEAPGWDGDVCGLQVTECRESVMEVRCLISAANAGDAFDLRCLVREKLIAYMARHHPEALPRTRADLGQRSVDESPMEA